MKVEIQATVKTFIYVISNCLGGKQEKKINIILLGNDRERERKGTGLEARKKKILVDCNSKKEINLEHNMVEGTSLVAQWFEKSESEVAQLCPTLCDPMKPTRILRPWDFHGRSTRVGCHFLLQVIKKKKKNLPTNAGDTGLIPGSRRFPWRREWQPTPVFLPGNTLDRGAQCAAVQGVAKSWTRLRD